MRRSIAAAAAAVMGLLVTAPPARAEEGWTWPVRGRVLTAYANDNARPYAAGMHRGIDIAARPGTKVVAARAGTVTFAGALGSAGVVAAVRASDGHHVTSYLHLSAVSVERGEQVSAGERIGEVGTSGRRSTPAPHLHFGVRVAEQRYVDPLSLLPPRGGVAELASPAPAPAPARLRADPMPVPVAARPAAAPVAVRPVPAGPIVRPRHGPLRHPVPAPAGRAALAPGDPGRAVLLAGLGLIALLLFGGVTVRANTSVNELLFAAARRVLRRKSPKRPAQVSYSDIYPGRFP